MKFVDQEVEYIDKLGSDLTVVNAARVSMDKRSDWEYDAEGKKILKVADKKLISYLAKHGHWTPFAQCMLQLRLKAPIFVARQLYKHQVGLVVNEVSRRYVDSEPEFFYPKFWRGRPINVKQGSSDERVVLNNGAIVQSLNDLVVSYNAMISLGVAPEQARMILPQNMMTEWYWLGSLAAWARIVNLRTDSHAQQETQEIAEKINCIPSQHFPEAWKALTSSTKTKTIINEPYKESPIE